MDDTVRKKERLSSSLLKGFAAGIIVSHINKTLVLGVLVGTAAGLYVEQNYKSVPNVEKELKKFWEKVKPRTGD